jgi:U3 small nucleolar RNA-associated protein 3
MVPRDPDGMMDATDELVRPDVAKLSVKEQMQLVKSTMPELLKLRKSFIEVNELMEEEDLNPSIKLLGYLYLTNVAFYFSIVSDDSLAGIKKSHPVLNKLEILKGLLEKALSFDLAVSQDESQDSNVPTDVDDEHEDDRSSQIYSNEERMDEIDRELSGEESVISVEDYTPIKDHNNRKRGRIDIFGEKKEMLETDIADKIANKKASQFLVKRDDKDVLQKFETKVSKEVSFDKSGLDVFGEGSDEEIQSDSDNEFYDQVVKEKKRKVSERESFYEDLQKPLETDDVDGDELEGDAKRKATYKILANRGLTPYRKKENRNPRVKKRMKYDKALKKLSSVRKVAVDKTKVSSRYQGERTGIKSNLARSTKF